MYMQPPMVFYLITCSHAPISLSISDLACMHKLVQMYMYLPFLPSTLPSPHFQFPPTCVEVFIDWVRNLRIRKVWPQIIIYMNMDIIYEWVSESIFIILCENGFYFCILHIKLALFWKKVNRNILCNYKTIYKHAYTVILQYCKKME